MAATILSSGNFWDNIAIVLGIVSILYYRNSYSHGNPYSNCDTRAQVDPDTTAASDAEASPVGMLLRVLKR